MSDLKDNLNGRENVRPRSSLSRFWAKFKPASEPSIPHKLYDVIVRHARFPLYYERLGVPDTPEGRFEVLALHAGLVVRRLVHAGEEEKAIAQSLFDLMFMDLDVNLRELGIGDLSVGKQVKRLAQQFYARLDVLEHGFEENGDHRELRSMLVNNLYHGAAKPSAGTLDQFISILVAIERCVAEQESSDLGKGMLFLPEEPMLLALSCETSDDGH